MTKGYNLQEAWQLIEDGEVEVLYVKTSWETDNYGTEISVIESLRRFRDEPYVPYVSGEYPSYFDQDDYGDDCIYGRHILGTFYKSLEDLEENENE